MTTRTRKRPVNLTLDEELVVQAKGMTANLSGVVEQLLSDYVQKQSRARDEKSRQSEITSQAWNAFNESTGVFSDEHSTL